MTVERPFAPVQWAAIAGSLAVLVWSVPGLVANPDFAVGDGATAERALGVDMNGWHAVSGLLVAFPGFVAMLRAAWSAPYCLAAAGALLNLATSAIFLAGALSYHLGTRRRPVAARLP